MGKKKKTAAKTKAAPRKGWTIKTPAEILAALPKTFQVPLTFQLVSVEARSSMEATDIRTGKLLGEPAPTTCATVVYEIVDEGRVGSRLRVEVPIAEDVLDELVSTSDLAAAIMSQMQMRAGHAALSSIAHVAAASRPT